MNGRSREFKSPGKGAVGRAVAPTSELMVDILHLSCAENVTCSS